MGTDTINQIGHHINEVSIIYTDGEDSKEDYKKIKVFTFIFSEC